MFIHFPYWVMYIDVLLLWVYPIPRHTHISKGHRWDLWPIEWHMECLVHSAVAHCWGHSPGFAKDFWCSQWDIHLGIFGESVKWSKSKFLHFLGGGPEVNPNFFPKSSRDRFSLVYYTCPEYAQASPKVRMACCESGFKRLGLGLGWDRRFSRTDLGWKWWNWMRFIYIYLEFLMNTCRILGIELWYTAINNNVLAWLYSLLGVPPVIPSAIKMIPQINSPGVRFMELTWFNQQTLRHKILGFSHGISSGSILVNTKMIESKKLLFCSTNSLSTVNHISLMIWGYPLVQ